MSVSVLIPAHDEAAWLPACLEALLASEGPDRAVEIVVIANGCSDDTAALARAQEEAVLLKGWRLEVLELAQGSKIAALNAGEAAASGAGLVYLDADVTVSPRLIAELAEVLDTPAPRYASGRPRVRVAAGALLKA